MNENEKLDSSPANLFVLPEHSIISVSGGRTSGLMLRLILDANGGVLPETAIPVFCNTGKECAETLDFVEEMSQRWGVPIRWLEYRNESVRKNRRQKASGKATDHMEEFDGWNHHVVEVDHKTASRNGEPFRMVIQARNFLPNVVMRFCTAELKIRTTNRFVRQILGWEKYANAIGLRADEPTRVAKMHARRKVTAERTLFGEVKHVERGASHPPGESKATPLADAGITNEDVLAFWRSQPFDLRLPVDEKTGKTLGGNCDLCFLKGVGNIVELIRQNPECADWWVETETLITGRERSETARFRSDRPSYSELRRIALGMADEPGWISQDRGGIACGGVDECNCTD